MSLLSLTDVHIGYGGIKAVKGISFHVALHELVCLIGANGAGKSTTLKAISGLLTPTAGTIYYDNDDIGGHPTHEIAAKGLRLVPEGRGVFPILTIEENLQMGAYTRHDKAGIAQDIERMFTLFPRLKERRSQTAGTLSGGEQQMLAIGRALMTNPKVLLLDEPSEGLAPQIVREVGNVLITLKAHIAMLLVEQNLGLAMKVADDVVLLNTGRVVFSGTRETFQAQQADLHSHLGVE